MFSLAAKEVKDFNIQSRRFFIILKNVQKQTRNSFTIKFKPNRIDRKSSYKIRLIFDLSSHLIALLLGQNSVKGIRVTKSVKEIEFERVWSKLESKKVSGHNNSKKSENKFSFYVKQCTTGKVSFLFFKIFFLVLTKVLFQQGD